MALVYGPDGEIYDDGEYFDLPPDENFKPYPIMYPGEETPPEKLDPNDPGVAAPTGKVTAPTGSDIFKKLLDKATTPEGLASLFTLGGSLLGMNKSSASPGWKGVIDPNAYVANRAQIEQPEYQPYSGKPAMGGRQFTDVTYSKPGAAAPPQTVNGVPLADFLAKKGIGGLPKDFGPREDDQAGPLQPGNTTPSQRFYPEESYGRPDDDGSSSIIGLGGVKRLIDPATGFMYQNELGGKRMQGRKGGNLSVKDGTVYEDFDGDNTPLPVQYMQLQDGKMVAAPEGKFFSYGKLYDNEQRSLDYFDETGQRHGKSEYYEKPTGPDMLAPRAMTMDIKPGDILGFNGTTPILAQENTGSIPPGFTNTETGGGFAMGGVAGLAHGGRYLHGKTDGMADKLNTTIDEKQAAKLSHGEFVIPADVVSHLGNGNSTAGADVLYRMMDRVRKARTGNPKQGKQINPEKFMPGGLAALPAYADGGPVAFETGALVKAPGTGATGMPSTNESNLSSWAGAGIADYIQKGTGLAQQPYQAYKGPLTAGTSPLQQQAFTAAGNLSVPASIGQAATAAGDVGARMGAMSYTPTTSTNQFTAPGAYQAANNANQYTATSPYDAANVTTGTFGTQQAQQYMNPYLQASLDPQLAEARRQSQITQMGNNAQAAKAGAFGGSRGALMNTETQRNLGTNLANITGQGYNTAYNNATQQFNADQARQLQAQQQTEQSRQFGAGQALSNAQNMAQYGLAGLNANEASRQFGAGQAMTSAQQQAQYGNLAQTQNEQSRQYGNTFGLNALQGQLGAINAQGQFGNMQNLAGIANLNALTSAGAVQRGIEAENVAAQKAAFEEERGAPMANVLATQALYKGLPTSTVTSSTATTPAQQAAETVGQMKNVYGTVDELLYGKKPA